MRLILCSSACLAMASLLFSACGGGSSTTSPTPDGDSSPTSAPATLQPLTPAASPSPSSEGPDASGFTCDPLETAPTVYLDPDGDGFGFMEGSCADSPYLSLRRGDCDESSRSVYPGATDVAGDGQDSDCGGTDSADPHVGLSASSRSFQDAVKQATSGQRVWVGPGDYTFAQDLIILPGVEVLSTDGADATALEGTDLSPLTVGKRQQAGRAVLDGFLVVHPTFIEAGVVSAAGSFLLQNLRFWGSCDTYFGAILVNEGSGGELSNLDIRDCHASAAGGISVIDSSDMLLRDVSISGSSGKFAPGGLWIYQSSVRAENLDISAGLGITEGTDPSVYGGGAILVQGNDEGPAELELSGWVSIRGCSTPLDGGAISLKNALLTGDGELEVLDSDAAGDGGGIHAVSSHITLSNLRLEGNQAQNGGGIWLGSSSSLTLDTALFLNNLAFVEETGEETPPSSGGGLFASGAALTLSRVTFEGNSASSGGGAYLLRPQSYELSTTSFINNDAPIYGGGLFYNVTEGHFSGLTFFGNSAGSGGGLFGEGGAWVTDSTFEQNSARDSGGGLRLVYGSVASLDIIGNSAESMGGGMQLGGYTSTMQDVFIADNHAGDGGGGLYIDGSTRVSASDCLIAGNRSEQLGGGLMVDYGAYLQGTRIELEQNTTALNGGGLYGVQAKVALSESLVANNAVDSGYGGGINMEGEDMSLTLADTLVSGNQALDGAGVLLLGDAAFTRTTFSANVAEQNGGGLHVYGGYALGMDASVVFSFNLAGTDGGAIFMQPCYTPVHATLESVTYVGNTAGYSGDSNCL